MELHIQPYARELLAIHGLDSVDALMRPTGAEPLDKPGLESWRRRSRLRLGDQDGSERVFYLKCFDRPPRMSSWRTALGAGQEATGYAAGEVVRIEALRAAGIPTLRWAAWGREMEGGGEIRSFVLTEAVPGYSLESWLPGCLRAMPAERRESLKPVILNRLAELVGRFHSAGFVHRDLYLSHVFIDLPAAREVSLTIIDLQRVFRPRRLVTRWQVKDLAQLHYSMPDWFASAADRLDWLRCYLGTQRLDARQKRLVVRVVRKARRISRHDRRRLARQAS